MSETNVSTIRSTRTRTPRKPKKSQIPIALFVTILIIAFGIYLGTYNVKLTTYWIFGISFGYILQRSRFCFTAAFRDPCITGSTSVSRSVIVALALTTIGFTGIKYSAFIKGNDIPGMGAVAPIGLPLVLGAVLFGIGMVIAGGCASGTLMRVGEGFSMQMLSLVFFVIGSLWGAHDMGFWGPKFNANAPKVFLPDIFGWFGALVVQALILLLLYIAAVKWQEKKMGTTE
ncbi:MAG: YeeE/YedE family protein [Epulopiscium sp.]|nr:YeeE/YedE family protein [Candidatus Epulonipiscium sp.]